jgi:hypothetical protein
VDFAKSGLAVLRAGRDFNAKQVVLNYMGYEGGHSHLDQLGIVFLGLGRTLAPDAGSIKYEDPVHTGWYKQSVSHNVLIVNGKSQSRAPIGTLDAFVAGAQLQVARASSAKAYPGVNQSRTVLLTTDYMIDLFEARGALENTFDWVYHNYGDFSTELSMQPAPGAAGKANGYGTDELPPRPIALGAGLRIAGDQQVRLYMPGASGTQVITSDGLVAARSETKPRQPKCRSQSFVVSKSAAIFRSSNPIRLPQSSAR